MQGSRRPTIFRFGKGHGAAPMAAGNSRARYALAFAAAGAALLLASDVLGAQRQRTAESLAARIIPFDSAVCGYYMIDTSLAPLARADLAFAHGLYVPWWLVIAFAIGMMVFAWHSWKLRRRPLPSDTQRYRRPRATRAPARVVAKRQAVLSALQAAPDGARSLTVRQLMTESTVIAPPTASWQTLMSLLTSAPLRHVLICEHGGRLLGIVTDRDLRHRRGRRAVDLMTRAPVCVPSGALLGPATALMVDHQISCLPVVDEGRVRGLLTADDVALALGCVLQARESVRQQPAIVDETVVLADVQGLCDTVRLSDKSKHTPAPVASE
jgi:acetoin utilization protein AcuB